MKSSKGSAYERDFAKKLSLWFTYGERDDIFWRSSQSGGRATTRAKIGKSTANQYGDITATDPIGQCLIDNVTIELKRGYNNHSLMDVLYDKQNSLYSFIEQARTQAENAGTKYWWLIHKPDRRNPLIYIPFNFASFAKNLYDVMYPCIALCYKSKGIKDFVYCYPFDDFLEHVDPAMFRNPI